MHTDMVVKIGIHYLVGHFKCFSISKVEEALARVAEANIKASSNSPTPSTTTPAAQAPIKSGAMKGVPPALLAKVIKTS